MFSVFFSLLIEQFPYLFFLSQQGWKWEVAHCTFCFFHQALCEEIKVLMFFLVCFISVDQDPAIDQDPAVDQDPAEETVFTI